jgi:hypothetical protein
MSDVTRLTSLTYGLNASATTIGTAPGTFATVLPRSSPTSFLPRSRQAIDRALYSVDGRRFMRVFGVKDIGELQLPVEFKGVSGNTGAGITSAGGWELVMEQGNLLASLFGSTAATTTVGAAPTVTSGTGSSLTVSTNVLANLDIILVQTSIGTEARQVVSGGGTTTVTVDRAWVGTPTASSTVIRAARYSVSTSQTIHTPVWFNCEGENWRRRYADCQPSSLVLNVPNAGLVEADFAFLPNDWDDQAEANPAFAAPTAGSPVVSGGSQFFIGANSFMLRNARLTVNVGMVMRETTTGINGIRGGLATDKTNIMLEGELYVGDNAGVIGDVSDDTGGAGVSPFLNDILGDGSATGTAPSSVDVSLQVGTAAGAAMFLRIPAADFRSAGVREGGPFAVLPFQAFATAPASGSPFSLGVF